MIELLKETGLSFTNGTRLTSTELNILNNSINRLSEAVNALLKMDVNINAEENDPTKVYTLREALELVPQDRRVAGIKVRFKESAGVWKEYVFVGTDWNNLDSWSISLDSDKIDGGEW